MGLLHPLVPTHGTSIWSLLRIFKQSLEEEFCELRLAIIPRNSAAEQGGSGRKFWLCHNVPLLVRRLFKIPPQHHFSVSRAPGPYSPDGV
jgi:hypothetical protein